MFLIFNFLMRKCAFFLHVYKYTYLRVVLIENKVSYWSLFLWPLTSNGYKEQTCLLIIQNLELIYQQININKLRLFIYCLMLCMVMVVTVCMLIMFCDSYVIWKTYYLEKMAVKKIIVLKTVIKLQVQQLTTKMIKHKDYWSVRLLFISDNGRWIKKNEWIIIYE